MILVENHGDSVSIRAVRDNFSERRKALFIHELAAEGFIPDEFQYFTNTDASALLGVRWVIDGSWIRVPAAVIKASYERCVTMYVVALVAEIMALDWLFLRTL